MYKDISILVYAYILIYCFKNYGFEDEGFGNEGFEVGIFLFLATPLPTTCRGRHSGLGSG